jgi:hypothetical protein
MAARLKRLEGMVRNMMDGEETAGLQGQQSRSSVNETPSVKGQLVQSNQGLTYIGATHCMAILEDVGVVLVKSKKISTNAGQIEDMKSYFEDDDELVEGNSPQDETAATDLLIQSGGPSNRKELLAQLPEKHVADRLIMRYFSSASPAQREYRGQ